MIRKYLYVSLVLVFGCRNNDYSGPLNSFKRYPFKNVHLSYTFTGDARGREDLYIADYGKYETRDTKIELLLTNGIRPKEESGITRLTDVYTIDHLQKKVMHRHVRVLDSLYHLDASSVPSSEDYLQTSMRDFLFINGGIDTIGGFPATRWEPRDGSMKLWVWNALLLKKYTISQNGIVWMDLVQMDTNWVADSSKFRIPSDGYEVVEDTKPQ
ncbi:MAG TPA: hypothetical protein VEW28_03770 [Candidatus Kapabacteria bacterium]|nr:hypothetical protein [Candidatus Kapabacteria bacterium]